MMMGMTYEEFTRQLRRAGLSAREFAELIVHNPNSITNYSREGHVSANLAVIATLMAAMADRSVDFRAALSEIEIKPNKPRGSATEGNFGGNKQLQLRWRENAGER